MGYAMIAGLPPIIGLYTAFMPVLFYTFFASSRHLSVGPSAMLSLLVLTAFTQLKAKTLEEKLDYAMILALLAGIIQILVGILRLGFIVNLMSHPVLSGFTAAAGMNYSFTYIYCRRHYCAVATQIHFGHRYSRFQRIANLAA